jgi:hypothetical protein
MNQGEKEKIVMRSNTNYGESDETPRRRVTKFDGDKPALGDRTADPREAGPKLPRIVGMLLSFSRDPTGEIFPIREGRNTIGSGETKEGDVCDILFPEDRKMSGFHAVILYRRGRCFISDQLSTNGTFVNDEEVDKLELPNYARLILGKTQFTFIKADDKAPARDQKPEAIIEDDEELVRQRTQRGKREREPPLI